ncbi:MAG TPA: malto-oligosyltrehalose synthase [Parasegetibacter sp.]
MKIPVSTYRVQLNQSFTLKDLAGIIDYLHELRVSTIYASPIFKAEPGSTHGYDCVDPDMINPEIGTLEDLKAIALKLKQLNMTWIQDIVPNHMAFSTANRRLQDVLERGKYSPYYRYFDIDWNHSDNIVKSKLMVPFLGFELSECIEKGEIRAELSKEGFFVNYLGNRYPLTLASGNFFAALISELTPSSDLVSIFTKGVGLASQNYTYDQWQQVKKLWFRELFQDSLNSTLIVELGKAINASRELLMQLLNEQNYVLCWWRTTENKINYRRFFTVNSLICLSMESEQVFREHHTFLFQLYEAGLIQGLRIDHIDGLRDPEIYLDRLRKMFGDNLFVVAEKILEAEEQLPAKWQIRGTTGYDFLAQINQVLTHPGRSIYLREFYHSLIQEMKPYHQVVFDSKKKMLYNYMRGELNNLTEYFFELGVTDVDISFEKIQSAIALFMVCLSVYRIYPSRFPLSIEELKRVDDAMSRAAAIAPDLKSALDLVHRSFEEYSASEALGWRRLHFIQRLMQFTGPLTAKGVEDTSFYIYNAHISHNEVGDTPLIPGTSVNEFHLNMTVRSRRWLQTMNASATHDTKRGEDARIRINLLSHFCGEWMERVREWKEINEPIKSQVDGYPAPSANEEYFIYQAMVGGCPVNGEIENGFVTRLKDSLIKALREARQNSSWEVPDEVYENACLKFVTLITDKRHGFLHSFISFHRRICGYARTFSLAQVLIKLTAPGIPDIYQGCEFWDLSFVDPDNRRPVDYNLRIRLLEDLKAHESRGWEAFSQFIQSCEQPGAEKLYVTWKALMCRRQYGDVFEQGRYIPLYLSGHEESFICYLREYRGKWIFILAPVKTDVLKENGDAEADKVKHSPIDLPEDAPRLWTDQFSGLQLSLEGRKLMIGDLLINFPLILLFGGEDFTARSEVTGL